MRKVFLLTLLIISVMGLAQAQSEPANWTILHYTAVDNNLEGAAFNDYYEMQVVGSGDGVNIVTQLDRAEGFESRFGDWTDTRRFFIEQVPALPVLDLEGKRNALVDYFVQIGAGTAEDIRAQAAALDEATINSIFENNNVGVSFEQAPVQELGEVDMGDPEALTDFIVWGAQNYPAEHYLIVIGSHGGGWRGIGPDDGSDHSMLQLPEIDAALGAAREQLGIDKFDIVGFDACLMGVLDVAVMLEPHADYVLFSQEVIPSNGWEYTNSIAAMQANPDWSAYQVGANFVDNYIAYYAGPGARTKVDLGLVETAGLPTLLQSLNDFSQAVAAEPAQLLSALGTARNNSQNFGASLGDRAEYYSYIDLRDFMTWFSVQTSVTEEAYLAAQAVIGAFDQAVVYATADSKLPGSNGLAVYLPATQNVYDAFGTDYPALAPGGVTFWQDYLNQFYATIATELDGSALQLEITNLFTVSGSASTLDTPVVFFNAAGKGVIDLGYTIVYVQDDGTRVIVDASPLAYTTILPTGESVVEYPTELTPSTFTWSVEFPYLSDGINTVLSLPNSSGSSNEMSIQGTYVNAQGSQPAYLIFDNSTYTYSGMLAIADSSPYEVRPAPGDQFIVDLITIAEDGSVNVTPQTAAPLTFGVEPFTFQYQPAISGNYELNLNMTDLANNRVFTSVGIQVNNDGVDGSLRGYTDTNEGIYFQYPRTWGDSFTYTNEDGSETYAIGDDDGVQTLYITSYPETDALAAIEAELQFAVGEPSEIGEGALGGLPGYNASYTYETEDGTAYRVIVASVFNELSNSSTVLRLESAAAEQADVDLLTVIDSSFLFFPAVIEP
ncbi:MAG TPA: clostripain-related cysteine peptidase [Aggregatilineales bacterium]|nr:clostripain-related cysteine peptidase [Aggregatilineales bacterium]